MSDPTPSEPPVLFGDEHVRRYQATDGREGHDWRGTTTLILTTRGRSTGQLRATPLIYRDTAGSYVVVASKGGAPTHPAWYLNLLQEPMAEIQVRADRMRVRARTATGAERERLWDLMAETWPAYNDYKLKTAREIPVVVLDPVELP